jgi:hypothetical protein
MRRIPATFALGLTLAGFAESAIAQVVVVAPAAGTVVCETRRQQFADSYGWRVRDIIVCSTR